MPRPKKLNGLSPLGDFVTLITKTCGQLIGLRPCAACKDIGDENPGRGTGMRKFAMCYMLDSNNAVTGNSAIIESQALSGLHSVRDSNIPGTEQVSV